MAIGIGEILVFLLVLGAAVYLLYRVAQSFSKPTDCGCNHCDVHKVTPPKANQIS